MIDQPILTRRAVISSVLRLGAGALAGAGLVAVGGARAAGQDGARRAAGASAEWSHGAGGMAVANEPAERLRLDSDPGVDESDPSASVVGDGADGVPVAAVSAGLLGFPVDASAPLTVLNNFGARSTRRGPCGHQGIDIFRTDGRPDQPLLAVVTGRILRLEDDPTQSQGLAVVLRGPSGDVYRYHHMARFADGLAAGRTVARGEVIGAIGTTGNAASFAPHLHFEVRSGRDRGPAVDPVPLLAIPAGVTVGPPTGCRR
jgi:murein DD-endopeptidase MepM/ murein hydrolase activator NlpD